jgi:hypothetical protein
MPARHVRNGFGRMGGDASGDNNLATIRTQPRLRGSTNTARTLQGQGVQYRDDPELRSRKPERSIPHYKSQSGVSGVEAESARADLRHLDRRSVLVQDLETVPAQNLPLWSDVYADNVQSRVPRNQRTRLPMEAFLHNHSAIPTINEGSNHVPVTDDRVKLRKKAFDAFMERSFQPPPIEFSADR